MGDLEFCRFFPNIELICPGKFIFLCTNGIKDSVSQRAEGELGNSIFNAMSA